MGKEKETKGSGGLSRAFLTMTIFPLVILGIIIIGSDYYFFTNSIQSEVKKGLNGVACSVIASYENNYEGDFNLLVNETDENEKYLRIGETVISSDTTYIDEIKEETGVDITVFFYDIRMLTTITDENGDRVTGSTAHQIVVNDVLQNGRECFFERVKVGGREYFAEYVPFFSENGVCLGMVGVAKPSSEVFWLANHSVMLNLMLIVFAILVVIIIMSIFSSTLVRVLRKMERFLGEISEGHLDTSLDETILSRQDEIGDMGRFTIHVQASLKKLIERDALTGLYNRRSGQIRIQKQFEKGEPFSVVMGDIDFFKKVNDTYGHDAGDEVLRQVARIISDGLVGKGYVARWGGEEFLMVLERMDAATAAGTIEGILDTIRNTVIESGEHIIKVTMSYGVVEGNFSDSIEYQIKRADKGLYYAKEHGRNQVVNVELLEEASLEEHPDNTVEIKAEDVKKTKSNEE